MTPPLLGWWTVSLVSPTHPLVFPDQQRISDIYSQVAENLKGAVAAHGRNWIWPDSSIDVWCEEKGADGFPPVPDDKPLPWLGGCDVGTFAYSYIRKNAYWFHTGYTIVFRPRMWRSVTLPGVGTLPGKRSLNDVLSLARSIQEIAQNPEYLVHNRGETYLHELMHLDDLSHPEPPEWEDIDSIEVSPRPKENPSLNDEPNPEFRTFNTTLWLEAGSDDIPDNTPVPAHEPPPAPPQCLPSNTAADPSLFIDLAGKFCSQVVSVVAIVLSLDETALDPPVMGATIKTTFSYTPAESSRFTCALDCVETFKHLASSYQTNSHTLTGRADVVIRCGT
ncbi:hypothetical protein LTR84_012003 [Exophiala bonariae]|uniref:Uncharacterized protein n=1 Tax=Exophiala bonariae TaxID=1690606 RepID=A0AAV9MRF5_9EURO|nr:hypothetical protein LTR84_012003 [Exophiala bonariae]